AFVQDFESPPGMFARRDANGGCPRLLLWRGFADLVHCVCWRLCIRRAICGARRADGGEEEGKSAFGKVVHWRGRGVATGFGYLGGGWRQSFVVKKYDTPSQTMSLVSRLERTLGIRSAVIVI